MNDVEPAPTRTVRQIVRANVLTRFNGLLGALLLIILIVGPLQDALFGGVIVANTLIGIVQELRAKWTLDRLAVLSAPKATVLRAGTARSVPVSEVVLDDVLELAPGDQVVVDGRVVASRGLEVDESLLTGESEPLDKPTGATLLSGSFVAAGSGCYRATKVGRDAYAVRLAEEGRRFTLARSELRAGIDVILRGVTWAILPTAALLFVSQLRSHGSAADSLRASVAGTVAMVPEGLVLLTSIAFAVGVVRLGRRRALVQELAAVETLARVDVVCVDKTGTLTEGELTVERLAPVGGADPEEAAAALGALAGADPHPNASLRSVGVAYPPPGWQATDTLPFSSARKWSGAVFAGRGTWTLGAPEVLLARAADQAGADGVRVDVESIAASGRRVLLLTRAPGGLDGDEPPRGLVPAALVVLGERIRPDAPDTLRFFAEQGVAVKVISGDHPATAAAVARRAGLADAGEAVDARTLPDDPDTLGALVDERSVFGRVTPEQKREMIAALQARGHVVAMTGDGVNDVLALKTADIGVAMGGGSAASRAVAQVVLLDSAFASLPEVVGEGRRVIANIERVASLFVTKTIYAMLLALAVGVARLPFPFLPRHLTLVGTLTIGTPAFFLSLAPTARRARTGFVGRVLRFAMPAGLIAAAATFVAYGLARTAPATSLDEARTTATIVLASVGLAVLVLVASPLTHPRRLLVACMAGAVAATLVLPDLRTFFALDFPAPIVVLAAMGTIMPAVWLLQTIYRRGWLPPPGR